VRGAGVAVPARHERQRERLLADELHAAVHEERAPRLVAHRPVVLAGLVADEDLVRPLDEGVDARAGGVGEVDREPGADGRDEARHLRACAACRADE
jgi:hypothetical protein